MKILNRDIMKKNILFICVINMIVLFLTSCDDSEFYYNTDQRHTIYFDKGKFAEDLKLFTFAYYTFNDTVISIPVRYMGMPSDKEQSFTVKVVADTIGETAVEGTDFEIIKSSFEPGEVVTDLLVRIKRSEVLKDTVYGLSLRFVEDETFTPKYETFYKLRVEDGELPQPNWWAVGDRTVNRFLGEYYPEKYKMVLEKFKDLEYEYPDFYNYTVDLIGEFLHTVPENPPGELRDFYYRKYSIIWGKYVFGPVWEYFTNPDNILPGDDISKMTDPIELYK